MNDDLTKRIAELYANSDKFTEDGIEYAIVGEIMYEEDGCVDETAEEDKQCFTAFGLQETLMDKEGVFYINQSQDAVRIYADGEHPNYEEVKKALDNSTVDWARVMNTDQESLFEYFFGEAS